MGPRYGGAHSERSSQRWNRSVLCRQGPEDRSPGEHVLAPYAMRYCGKDVSAACARSLWSAMQDGANDLVRKHGERAELADQPGVHEFHPRADPDEVPVDEPADLPAGHLTRPQAVAATAADSSSSSTPDRHARLQQLARARVEPDRHAGIVRGARFRTVRDLVAGSGLAFVERRAHTLKGVPGRWHVYALAAADRPAILPTERSLETPLNQSRCAPPVPLLGQCEPPCESATHCSVPAPGQGTDSV